MFKIETVNSAEPVVPHTKGSAGKKPRIRQRVRQRAVKRAVRLEQGLENGQNTNDSQPKTKKPSKTNRKKGSGIMFVKHLPKGFYEDELRQFFEQFGEVLRVCVARSKKTQLSRGYGFVHFKFREVAEIAAEALNNYMMFNRVLKTAVLPKNIINIPRNFGKAYSTKGEHTKAYQRWMKRNVRACNSFLGGQRLTERCSKKINRLMRARKELEAAGIELPELVNTLSDLKEKENELKQAQLLELEQMDEDKPKAESKEPVEEATDDQESDDEDDDTAFAPLQPSDWTTVDPVEEDEVYRATKAERKRKALQKAETAGARIEWEKKKSVLKMVKGENKTGAPEKKRPIKGKLPLSKKKDENASKKVVLTASKKSKQALASKRAKSAKV